MSLIKLILFFNLSLSILTLPSIENITKKIYENLTNTENKTEEKKPEINTTKIVESKKKNFTSCSERLIDKKKILSEEDYNYLCDSIAKYPLFIIRIRTVMEYEVSNVIFFEATSYKFFDSICKNYKNMCKYGFLIDIYAEDKMVVIQPGEESKILVNDNYRFRTINSVRLELIHSEWAKALKKIIKLIVYKEEKKPLKNFPSTSDAPKDFFFYFLIPNLCFGFFILTGILFYGSKGYLNQDVFEFLDNLIEKWELITESEDNKIQLEPYTCIFCWKKTDNKKEYFMYCGHSYHEKCLRIWRLYQYRCCPCSYEAIKEIEEKKDKSEIERPIYLNIEDLKILLGLSLDAFRKENMYDYFVENEEKIDEFNNNYGVSLEELCWLYQNKLQNYKSYRIFYKMYKVWKMSCFLLAFYPNFLKSKKVKLITKLLKVKNKGGATIAKIY